MFVNLNHQPKMLSLYVVTKKKIFQRSKIRYFIFLTCSWVLFLFLSADKKRSAENKRLPFSAVKINWSCTDTVAYIGIRLQLVTLPYSSWGKKKLFLVFHMLLSVFTANITKIGKQLLMVMTPGNVSWFPAMDRK